MDKKDILKAAGVDYDGALSRFMGNEALLMRFLNKFLDDPNFLNLDTALEQGDAEKAFQAAHTLKGVCQNLSITALYHSSAELADRLRDGQEYGEDVAPLLERVKKDYTLAMDCIRQLA